jgi:hypothetical protein
MKTENINTLIELVKDQIKFFENQNIGFKASKNYTDIKKYIGENNSHIDKLDSCLSDLNKLKEFEYMTDMEIYNATKDTSKYCDGNEAARWMRDLIKTKLNN